MSRSTVTDSEPLTVDAVLAQSEWLRQLTRSLVLREDRADDVMQETLLRALVRRGQAVASIRPWLARVASNVARRQHSRDVLRSTGETHRARSRDADAPPGEPVDHVVAQAEMHRRVTDATLGLDEPYRTTILLRYLRGFTCPQVAEHMSVPVETVRTRIKRGLARLRAVLDQDPRHRNHGGCRAWALPILGAKDLEPLLPVSTGSAISSSVVVAGSMNKILTAVSAAMLAALLWFFWPVATDAHPQPRTSPASTEELSADATAPEFEIREAVVSPPEESATPTTGSLAVTVRYSDGETPAAGVTLGVWPRSGPHRALALRRVETDVHGEARLEGLTPGRYAVEKDRATGNHDVEIIAGTESALAIVLPKGIDVTGIVVNREGQAVAGATVRFELFAWLPIRIQPIATTDVDGRFVIRGATPNSCVSAFAAGYAPSTGHSLFRARTDVELRLVLNDAGGSLAGRVEDPAGRPVAGAVVRVGPQEVHPLFGQITMPDGSFGVMPRPIELRTDARGAFRIDSATLATCHVAVRAAGFAPWSGTRDISAGAESTVIARLTEGATCEGQVEDEAGNPMAGVSVHTGEHLSKLSARTASDGSFRIEHVPPGEVVFTAMAKGKGKVVESLRCADGETVRWDVTFSTGVVLRGRVLTEAGDPVVGEMISVTADPASPARVTGRFFYRTETGRDGRFRVLRCPDDVTVSLHGWRFEDAERKHVHPGSGELVIRVKPRPRTVQIVGRVTDPAGQPIGDAVLSGTVHGRTAPDTGTFELGKQPAGTHHVSIEAKGFATFRTGDRELAEHETWDLGAIQLVRGGTVKLHLDRSRLRPALPIVVLLVDASDQYVATGQYVADVVEAGRAVPGPYHVHVAGDGVASQRLPVVIAEGAETELTVTLTPGTRRELRIFYRTEQARVTIADANGVVVVHRMVQRYGDKEYARIRPCFAPGRYKLDATTTTGARAAMEFTVTDKSEPSHLDVRLR